MAKSITLTLTYDSGWQEFFISYYEDGVLQRGSFHTSSLAEALDNLAYLYDLSVREGNYVTVRENSYTRGWRDYRGSNLLETREGNFLQQIGSNLPTLPPGHSIEIEYSNEGEEED